MTFEELVAEGAAAPTEGWDFSWFEGRATEERPPWGYARLMAGRMARATAALDVETGGGEVLATVTPRPPLLVATESWPPNVAIARDRLRPLGAHVVAVADAPALPFAAASFDLVVSRHPVVVLWEEIARVLRPGGTYLSQQIGAGTNRELTEFMTGPRPVNTSRSPERAHAAAEAAGLVVSRPAGVRAAGRVLRCRRRRVLPAQGALDRAGLHGRCLPRPPARHARPDPARRQLRLDGTAPPGRGPPTRVSHGVAWPPRRRARQVPRVGQLAWLTELML